MGEVLGDGVPPNWLLLRSRAAARARLCRPAAGLQLPPLNPGGRRLLLRASGLAWLRHSQLLGPLLLPARRWHPSRRRCLHCLQPLPLWGGPLGHLWHHEAGCQVICLHANSVDWHHGGVRAYKTGTSKVQQACKCFHIVRLPDTCKRDTS